MGFSRQEYWSGFPFPSPGDLLDPEIKAESPVLAGGFLKHYAIWEAHVYIYTYLTYRYLFNYIICTYICVYFYMYIFVCTAVYTYTELLYAHIHTYIICVCVCT